MKIQNKFACKILSAYLGFLMIWGDIGVVYAASTDIADVPMAIKNRAQPNIIFAIDDSASMDYEVLMPTNDGAFWWHMTNKSFVGLDQNDTSLAGAINFNNGGGANSTWKKYVYLFPNGTALGDRIKADADSDHYAVPPTNEFAWARSADYNPMYYNPAIRYSPWSASNDGTTTKNYSNASTTSAQSHPAVGSTTANLTANINSSATDEIFRMQQGMKAPVNAIVLTKRSAAAPATILSSPNATLTVETTVPNGEAWDVQISYFPATFYAKDSTCSTCTLAGPDGVPLRKFEIKSANAPFAKSSDRSDCAGTATCTYTEEIQNFANWFTYYRKRKLFMWDSIGKAFGNVQGIRVGMFGFNNRSNATMYDFTSTTDSANAKRLLNAIYKVDTSGGTPTKDALDYLGQQFMRTGAGAPIQYACQYNAGFVITDGYANAGGPTVSPANYDGQTTYSSFPYNTQYSKTGATITYPYQDSESNTLGDIAMKYYTENLRPDLTAGKVPFDSTNYAADADRNPNLHMNTFALGLGVKGTIFGTGSTADLNPYVYPGPAWSSVYTYTDRQPKSVDDLWHATLNGRGVMLSATNPDEAQTAILSILNDVIGNGGGAAAVTVSNPNVSDGDNTTYASSYSSISWTGELDAFAVDLTTGIPGTDTTWTNGTAKTQLDDDSVTSSSRKIVTYSDATSSQSGIQFQPTTATTSTKISAAQQTLLNTTSYTDGADVLAFLRGDRSKEGTTSPGYRIRNSRLGDTINAEPVILNPPRNSYADTGYSDFKNLAANASREKVIFQGANDGMMHVFSGNPTTGGDEKWAYVPSFLFSKLNNLSRKTSFQHLYYVDATPAVGDVDFGNTSGGSGTADWRSILVGGLGKGGRGFYALDVTNPVPTSEATAASKVLWEFPNNSTSAYVANMGYSFGKPIIVKTTAKGWVILATSGYNNGADTGGDGMGHIFVLNPRTGAVIKDISTGVGSSTTPSGLAHLSAYVDDADTDNTTEYVYGGDLLGNVWRIDLSGNNTNQWDVTKLATLVDSSGVAQPITTIPELGVVSNKRMILLGTGSFLGDKDVPGATSANASATQTQTMYGLVDDLSNSPVITPLRSNLVAQTITVSPTNSLLRVASTNPVDLTVKKGWYMDLPITGERIVTNPTLAVGALIFTSNIPSSDVCTAGGSSWSFSIDFETGGQLSDATYAAQSLSSTALASRPIIIKLPSGLLKQIVRLSDGGIIVKEVPVKPASTNGKRVSWRELTN
ncbi:MAG: PilC/PilY family type IV pilus protein [Pseudomonadota bacterium]